MRAKDLTQGSIAYHSELNPAVWDNDTLRLDARYKLLEIAKRVIEYLEVPNFKLLDVVLRGSMVNYNYTAYSDFDLHIITDYSTLKCDITEPFYMAKKKIWNDEHDITIKGHEVELYIEDKDEENSSEGIYSVLDNTWLKKPVNDPPTIDELSVNKKARDLMTQINRAVKSGNVDDMDRLKNKIKNMRQAGLDSNGEFSVENLAFKILRNKKLIEKLYKAIQHGIDQKLSLDERRKNKKKSKRRGYPMGGYYGYYWGGGYDSDSGGGDSGGGDGGGGGESISKDFANTLIDASQGPWTVVEAMGGVEMRASSILASTLASKPEEVNDRLKKFVEFKRNNPTQAWGGSDTLFVSQGVLAQAIPKLRHAHLNRDVSVFYTMEGRDPTVLKVYGVFSHKESGTSKGDNNQRIQRQLASQLKQAKI